MTALVHPFRCSPPIAPPRPVVVCVDDDPAILRSYGRLLRHEPYDVLTFEDPGRALALIGQAEVDLVLSDERMPSMSGTELLEEVLRRSPRTRCVLISASPAPDGAGERIVNRIAKPWDDEVLRGTIRNLVDRRRND